MFSIVLLARSRDFSAPEPAGAPEDPAVLFPKSPVSQAIALNLGLGSAVGEFGVTWQLAGLGPLEIELGAGDGFSGTQLSAMLKVALYGTANKHFTLGAGVAHTGGQSHWARTFLANPRTVGNPIWLNVDLLSYEYRGPSHVFASFALGFTKGLGGGELWVENGPPEGAEVDDMKAAGIPQARGEIGFWF